MLGLYVHVPFCAAICNYCNFNRGLFDEALKTRYVAALLTEIARAADGSPADTIFFGGGTPSLLEPAEVGSIVAALRQAFAVAPDAEVTLEANPETVTVDRLAGYREAGVTRVSFGAQSFRDEELVRLSRLHSAGRAAAAVGEARTAGFDNVSLDLMMWLPQQTIAQWLASVDRLIQVAPDHASLYLLELYPNAPLREAMARERWSLAPDDDAADMYLAAMARLDAAGYEQYEISNVARAGRMARHNLKYWEDGEWLGFGCGAHSTRDGRRWKNVSATGDYVDAVTANAPLAVDVRILSPQERAEEAAFTGLRLSGGVDLDAVRRRYGVDLWAARREALTPFVDAGILTYDVGRLRLSRRGMLLANEVMAVLLGPVVLE
ncbi:MAG: radical SAM family heme chaperone HemW [Vicinamibacterales bacterium]